MLEHVRCCLWGKELSQIKKAIRNYRWSFWFWMFLLLVDHHLKERRLKSGLRDLVQMFRISLGTAKKTISLYSDFSVARQTRLWLFSAILVTAFTSFSLNSSFILSFSASHRLNGAVT